ncbi:hypothetical protein M426DRAFT_17793 [Hypoxylon sp. CI-4A]|nr:hypothetical protein M426DRAFT_17793 [Hypoxylon sp. CI-4A]
MASATPESRPMPPGAAGKLANVALWLQKSAADFQDVNNVKICKNTKGLVDTTTELLKHFAVSIKSTPSQHRVTAIHFDKPAAIPIEKGWTIDVIPVHLVGEDVEIGGYPVDLENYFHLEGETKVSGDFFAVLLLSHVDV